MMSEERPKILCLGVSYPSIEAQLAARGHTPQLLGKSSNSCSSGTAGDSTTARRSITTTTATSEAAIECVQRGILTQMDGRDLARCLATEEQCNVDVYCVSQEKGAIYRPDRHLDANFNRASFVKALQKHFQGCQFDQIVLDYYWIPAGWDTEHWSKSFFHNTLIAFAKAKLLRNVPSSPAIMNEKYKRGIYLPFCFHCFKAIVTFGNDLKQHFNISFLRKNELDSLAWWSGTQSIDGRRMQNILGKRIDQEEVYCTFGPRHIKEMGDGSVSKFELVNLANSLEDFADIRFIVLETIPLVPPSDRLTMRGGKTAAGCFLGLVHPSKVKRGFRHVDTASIRTPPPPPPLLAHPTTSRKRPVAYRADKHNIRSKNSGYNLRNRSPRSVMVDDVSSADNDPVDNPLNPKKLSFD
jgi:hypothetical protein